MTGEFHVDGLIGLRWREWGAAEGPFGLASGGEEPVPGTAGKRQRFARGEIVWAPEQDMVVSVFQLRDRACLSWSVPRFEHEYFRVNSWFDSQPQGLHEHRRIATSAGFDMQVWVRLQGLGAWGFHVASFNDDDHTEQGWTPLVGFTLRVGEGAEAPPFPVAGGFFERWCELGAGNGLLGQPTRAAEQFAAPGSTAWRQTFERGAMLSHAAQGFGFVFSAHQVGTAIELSWGGSDEAYDQFRIDITRNGIQDSPMTVREMGLEWARPGRGSGYLRFDPPPGDATYAFVMVPGPGLFEPGAAVRFPSTPPLDVQFVQPPDPSLAPLPQDGSHGQAFASHGVRAGVIARHYVQTRRMHGPTGGASENSAIQLIAHLYVMAADPEFQVPGELPHTVVTHTLLRSSNIGHGQMGTSFDDDFAGSRLGDYDMALKGLMAVLYRYRDLITAEEHAFILRELVPARLPGRIDHGLEWYWLLTERAPETENHLLMINSSKYLVNKLKFPVTGDAAFDNKTNGVRDWLLKFMHDFACHDFMEFNATPYQRLTVHALLNLHEFGDDDVATGAQNILDYVTMKFAVSSTRGRRVAPFRRLKERVRKADDRHFNDLLDANADQDAALFLTYVGPSTPARTPFPAFQDGWAFNGMIAGPAAYRPPPAAYIAALEPVAVPTQHRFYHGIRPEMPEADEIAEGGVELYYTSPSFVLSAGGMFLNSGYGSDELQGYAQVAIAQATTLIPVRADAKFAELIRFEPYPGDRDEDDDEQLQRDAVNTGVHLGFACGANFEVPDRWLQAAGAAWDGPWLLLDLNRDELAATASEPDRRLGFYLAAYRTPVADPERLKVNYGTVPRDFGWLYAMEATEMPFATFAERVRTRNAFPDKLEWGGLYTFVTPHDVEQRYEFWMRPDQFKYTPRIFKVDGQPVLEDGFTSLPLVDGDCLRSAGHEGLIEIRGPGQDPTTAPLVLDHREPLAPVRVDNAGSWTQPQMDRAHAIIAFTRFLIGIESPRMREALDALRAFEPPSPVAVEYRQVLAQARHTVVRQLLAAGRIKQAHGAALDAIAAYRDLTGTPGAEVTTIASNLISFSTEIVSAGLVAESVTAAEAAVDVLRKFSPSQEALLTHRRVLAQACHVVVQQLIVAGRAEQAHGPALEAIQAYRDLGATPGADVASVAANLRAFSSELSSAGLTSESLAAAQAAADLRP